MTPSYSRNKYESSSTNIEIIIEDYEMHNDNVVCDDDDDSLLNIIIITHTSKPLMAITIIAALRKIIINSIMDNANLSTIIHEMHSSPIPSFPISINKGP